MIRLKCSSVLGTNLQNLPKTSQWPEHGANSTSTLEWKRKTWQKPKLCIENLCWQFTHTQHPTWLSWNFLAKTKSQSSCTQDKEESMASLVQCSFKRDLFCTFCLKHFNNVSKSMFPVSVYRTLCVGTLKTESKPETLKSMCTFSPHLVSTHAVTVEKANFLVLLSSHVVHTLVGLHISDL